MGFTSKPSVTVDSGHKRNSFIEVGYSTNFLKLAFEDEYVGEVNGFPPGLRCDENIDQTERMEVPTTFVFPQLLYSGRYFHFGSF